MHVVLMLTYLIEKPESFSFFAAQLMGGTGKAKKTSKGQTSLAKEATSGVQKASTLKFTRFVHVFYYVDFLKQFFYILEIST